MSWLKSQQVEHEVQDDMQKDKDEHGDQLVMQNRISWNAYNRIRKTEGLTATPKRKCQGDEDLPTEKKRKHGCNLENLPWIQTNSYMKPAPGHQQKGSTGQSLEKGMHPKRRSSHKDKISRGEVTSPVLDESGIQSLRRSVGQQLHPLSVPTLY